MKLGLVGAGNISATHARAAAAVPGVDIVAVWAPNLVRAESLAREHGARAFDSLEAMLDHGGAEMVAIGTPSGVHVAQAIAAATRGIHVLVEKPLDVTTARIDELNAVAVAHGVTVGVFFQDRMKPEVVELKRLIDEGTLGRLVLGSARVKWYRTPEYYSQSRWRGSLALDGGGALMNQGIHTLDLLQWLMGPVALVAARTATLVHAIESEDTVVASLEFASGALGVIEAGTSIYPGYPRRLEISGTEGTIVMEGDAIVTRDLRQSSGSVAAGPVHAIPAAPATIAASSPVVADASAHQRVLEDFIEALRAGRAPICDGHEARKSVALIERIYRSARLGTLQ